MPERACGCTWQTIEVADLPARVFRHRVGGTAIRFTRRCAQHTPMCRALEDWEIDMHRTDDDPPVA
jgi:hypothetical protein